MNIVSASWVVRLAQGFPSSSAGKGSAYNAGDLGSILWLGRSPGEGNSYPLQYSGLENSMDCIDHGDRKMLDMTEQLSLHFKYMSCVWLNFLFTCITNLECTCLSACLSALHIMAGPEQSMW